MLSYLSIHNFGLIDELSIDFDATLNILTGETGAGKSIIIDALRCALGGRFYQSNIRDEAKKCCLEAVFECAPVLMASYPMLDDYGCSEEGMLIIRRTIFPDGRNKIQVNNISVTAGVLKEIGAILIDFHGPHDHQMLLDPASHIRILDRLCSFGDTKEKYSRSFVEYQAVKKQLKEIEASRSTRERDLDLLGHQISELEAVALNDENYDQTQQAFARLANTERLFENTQALLALFQTDQIGISERISEAFSHLKVITALDDSTASFEDSLSAIQEESDSLVARVQDYHDSLSFSPEEAAEITRRCDSYTDILRKYGPTLADARSFHEKAKARYEMLSDLDHNDADLKKRLSVVACDLEKLAADISRERKIKAGKLKKTIEAELKDLGIKHILFECRIERSDLIDTGSDAVLFYISPNAGESVKPLSEIVSSGEAARVMLALKKALTKVDPIPVLVFDEIDAQIGGRLGTVTGTKLKELSHDRQVILITHLPQIASFGSVHFKVEKTVDKNRTTISIRRLEASERVKELALMMSGEKANATSVQHAKEMLERGLRG
jgi:DNA repair protein RecN (Recombination protein N)